MMIGYAFIVGSWVELEFTKFYKTGPTSQAAKCHFLSPDHRAAQGFTRRAPTRAWISAPYSPFWPNGGPSPARRGEQAATRAESLADRADRASARENDRPAPAQQNLSPS